MITIARASRMHILTLNEGLIIKNTIIKNGLNVEYSIGLTKSGKPRIIQKEDSTHPYSTVFIFRVADFRLGDVAVRVTLPALRVERSTTRRPPL